MSEVDENGLPTEKEFSRLGVFEDRLIDAAEPDGQSVLVGALTCNAQKEFIFHTANASEFLKRLTNMPQEEKRYPIKIERYDDPGWNYFKAVVSQLE
jgi:uncharacterized protein DUF695